MCKAVLTPFLFVVLIISFSCQKETVAGSENKFVSEVKDWFTNTILKEESKILSKPYTELAINDPKRVLARMNKLSLKPDWIKAKSGTIQGVEYTAIPLKSNSIKLNQNYQLERVFIFYRDKNQFFRMEVAELLTKNSKIDDEVSVAIAAFGNQHFSLKERLPNCDVDIFFYDKEYNSIAANEIRNGEWVTSKKYCTNRSNIEKSTTNLTSRTNEGCELWGCYLVEYNENGQVINETLLYTYLVGEGCGPGPDTGDNWEPTGGGSGESEQEGVEIFRTLTWHVYNTSGGATSPTGTGSGVNSMENVRGKRNSNDSNGGYFISASHHTSTCNSCNDPSNPNAAYIEDAGSTSMQTTNLVSSSVSGHYSENGQPKYINGSRNWSFNQIF